MLELISPNFSDLLKPNLQLGKFPDGDSHVHLPPIPAGKQEITIFHRLYPHQNDSIVELLLILGSLVSDGHRVSVVVPYLPYARQDKKKMDGEVKSAEALCDLLHRAGCAKLITFDCHFLNAEGPAEYGGLAIENLSMGEALIEHAKKIFGLEPFEVIGPDGGAAYLVKNWGGKHLTKVRGEYDANSAHKQRHIESLTGDMGVKGKNVLILDDMISSGSTMARALEMAREQGAEKIGCAATHGLFLHNALDKLQKVADFVFSSDTIVSSRAEVSIKARLTDHLQGGAKLF
ncbi:MAG: Ribose-phosphate pyrophosphokinase [Parcubacteria group bacterium GW2011_GWA2_51_12]|nr:MAG: Ribose-phosphate pyrophosphokinase [Parcubacteria group bacterium GW2011_GWA2_51_12]